MGHAPYTSIGTAASSGKNNELQLADLNGDGILDRVSVASNTYEIKVALGDGTGGFGAETRYNTGSLVQPSDFALVDVNGDGALDLVATDGWGQGGGALNGQIKMFINNGAGAFSLSATTYQFTSFGANTRISIAAGDFNGDGIADLAIGVGNFGSSAGMVHTFTGTIYWNWLWIRSQPILHNVA